MKNIFLILPLLIFGAIPASAEIVSLTCKTTLSELDPSVKEQYSVLVNIENDYALLNIDGVEFMLQKDYQSPDIIAFYRWEPWYRLAIDDKLISEDHKYVLGIPTDEPFARYTICEVNE